MRSRSIGVVGTVVFAVLAICFIQCATSEDPSESEAQALSPAFVQVASATPQAPTATIAVRLGRNEAAGDGNVVVIGWNDVTSTVTSVTDSQGLAYAVAAPTVHNASGPNSQAVYWAPGTHAAADTVTVRLNHAVSFPDVRVLEYSGIVAVDTFASAAGTSTTASAGPITTATPNELLVAAGTTFGQFFSTPGAGYTLRVLTQPNADIVEDSLAATPGSYSATAPNDGSTWVFQLVAFRGTAAPDGGADAQADAATDVAPDQGQDSAADVATDSAPDGSADATAEASADTGPDVMADTGADALLEASGDVAAEAMADAGADATDASEAGPDATVDATVDAGADAGSDATVDSGATGPVVLQHTSSSTNPLGKGETGNAFAFGLPNPVGAGNCLVLAISYQWSSTRTVHIADSLGDQWPFASVTATDGVFLTSAIYVLPNTIGGANTITVTFDKHIQPFLFTLTEVAGIAQEAPVNGISSAVDTTLPTFTPTLDGSLVWAYFADTGVGGTFAHQASNFTPGAGFVLNDADIAWGTQGLPHASEYLVQGAASPVTPSMAITQVNGADPYLGVAVSLMPGIPGNGTLPAPGIRVVRINHGTNENPPTLWSVQLPSVGNLLVLSTADWSDLLPVSSITDSNSNTWVKSEFDLSSPQVWYAANAATSSDLSITMHLSGAAQPASVELWDIAGASTTPFDVMAGVPLTDDPTGHNLFGVPTITPSGPGLTIASLALATGPASGVTSPAGATFDMVVYNGETDFDTMDNADGTGHVYNSDTTPQSWNWSVSNGSKDTLFSATAVHFR